MFSGYPISPSAPAVVHLVSYELDYGARALKTLPITFVPLTCYIDTCIQKILGTHYRHNRICNK